MRKRHYIGSYISLTGRRIRFGRLASSMRCARRLRRRSNSSCHVTLGACAVGSGVRLKKARRRAINFMLRSLNHGTGGALLRALAPIA